MWPIPQSEDETKAENLHARPQVSRVQSANAVSIAASQHHQLEQRKLVHPCRAHKHRYQPRKCRSGAMEEGGDRIRTMAGKKGCTTCDV
jgi:hypothetical protein